jgi:hypothetical protein
VSAFDHLESPLDEAPLFYIEPRDSDLSLEIDRQAAFVSAARKAGFKVAAITNGEMRGIKALNRANREGAWWGFPDLAVFGPGRFVAFPEFKNGKAMPKQHQIEALNALHRLGFPVGVFRTPGRAMAWLLECAA